MRTVTAICILFLSVALFLGCAGVETQGVPARHPERLAGPEANCLECHDNELTGTLKPFGTFSHTNSFLLRHGSYASQDQDLCSSCHRQADCLECHATKEELTPSLRRGDRPDRELPHRGDYIVQHRVDGRLDPGSCVRCHGNRNTGGCIACHR